MNACRKLSPCRALKGSMESAARAERCQTPYMSSRSLCCSVPAVDPSMICSRAGRVGETGTRDDGEEEAAKGGGHGGEGGTGGGLGEKGAAGRRRGRGRRWRGWRGRGAPLGGGDGRGGGGAGSGGGRERGRERRGGGEGARRWGWKRGRGREKAEADSESEIENRLSCGTTGRIGRGGVGGGAAAEEAEAAATADSGAEAAGRPTGPPGGGAASYPVSNNLFTPACKDPGYVSSVARRKSERPSKRTTLALFFPSAVFPSSTPYSLSTPSTNPSPVIPIAPSALLASA